jgi:transposase
MRPGWGRKTRYGAGKAAAIVEATLQTKPPGSTHWSTRKLAAAQGVSKNTIARVWQEHQLNEEFPGTMTLRLILDNYGSHGHERVRRRPARHPRFVLHFIPTTSSWLNLVESWFSQLSQKAVRRGAFRSVEDLEQAIAAFLAAWNTNPTPFVWTARVEKILEKIARARHRLEQIQPGCTSPKRRANCVANYGTLHYIGVKFWQICAEFASLIRLPGSHLIYIICL